MTDLSLYKKLTDCFPHGLSILNSHYQIHMLHILISPWLGILPSLFSVMIMGGEGYMIFVRNMTCKYLLSVYEPSFNSLTIVFLLFKVFYLHVIKVTIYNFIKCRLYVIFGKPYPMYRLQKNSLIYFFLVSTFHF
jgi:hypothetical protein